MIESLVSIGEVELEKGRLCLQAFPGSPFTLLSLHRDDLPAVLALSLDESELGVVEAAEDGPGFVSPRPLGLRLLQLRNSQGHELLLLRMVQRDITIDVPLEAPRLKQLRALCQARLPEARAARSHNPARKGQLQAGGALSLEGGAKPAFLLGLSHTFGPYGEFLQDQDVCAEIQARVDCVELEGKLFALRTRVHREAAKSAPRPGEDPDFVKFCQLGQQADGLLAQGYVGKGRDARISLFNSMMASKKLDSFLMAKLALSEMLTMVLAGDDQTAARLWTSSSNPEDPMGMGVMMLEKGQTGVRDLMLYRLLEGYLHSLNPEVQQAEAAVNHIMGQVCAFSREEGDPWLAGLALRNWRLHLNEVFETADPPLEKLKAWEAAQRQHGSPVLPKTFCLPQPEPWVITWGNAADPVMTIGPDGIKTSAKKPFWKRLLGLN